MEKWYIPITILPGVGLLLLSTSNLIIALNTEIKELLEAEDCQESLVKHKISQQQLLSFAMIALYIAAGLMVFSGLLDGLDSSDFQILPFSAIYPMLIGVSLIFIAIIFMITYALRAIRVRKEQYANFLNKTNNGQ